MSLLSHGLAFCGFASWCKQGTRGFREWRVGGMRGDPAVNYAPIPELSLWDLRQVTWPPVTSILHGRNEANNDKSVDKGPAQSKTGTLLVISLGQTFQNKTVLSLLWELRWHPAFKSCSWRLQTPTPATLMGMWLQMTNQSPSSALGIPWWHVTLLEPVG